MVQIYGYAFHSPLIMVNLTPLKDHYPIYLEARWVASDLYKNVSPLLEECSTDKTVVLFAGSLPILQSFLKTFPDVKQKVKVVLFDFPGLVNPFRDPLIKWVDCDHQVGGAWQITKSKLSSFEALLREQQHLDNEGKELIMRMTRFVSRDRVSEIEKFHEYMPSNYKEMLDYDMTDSDSDTNKANYDAAKDTSWKKKTFTDVLKDFMVNVPKPKRKSVFDLILSYQLNKVSKRDYNTKIKPFVENSAALKKTVITVRKWMDDTKRGRALHRAYLDYVSNLTRRSWKTILEENGLVDELDLLVVIKTQHRDVPDLALFYLEELKEINSLPSNMHAPERTVRWLDGSLHYHAEPPDLQEVFDLA
jgi:hypothetical protein